MQRKKMKINLKERNTNTKFLNTVKTVMRLPVSYRIVAILTYLEACSKYILFKTKSVAEFKVT